MALSRMEFFPAFVLKRNKLRVAPCASIVRATGMSIVILLFVGGHLDILGDLYAFGLLGAFSLTCLGLDIIRHRERKAARAVAAHLQERNGSVQAPSQEILRSAEGIVKENKSVDGPAPVGGLDPETIARLAAPARNWRTRLRDLWYNLDFWLGILTTFLVILASTTNLIYKPMATPFRGILPPLSFLVPYTTFT